MRRLGRQTALSGTLFSTFRRFSSGSAVPKMHSDVLAVGMGPTGLAHALEACQSSKESNVTLVTDRAQFTRPQILSLNADTGCYLSKLVGERAFSALRSAGVIEQKANARGELRTLIQIRSHEEMLYEQLKSFGPNRLRVVNSRSYEPPKINVVARSYHFPHRKEAGTEEDLTVKFKYLVMADGARHSTLSGLANTPFSYVSAGFYPQVNPQNVTATYALDLNTYNAFRSFVGKPNAEPTSEELVAHKWVPASAPEFRVFMTNRHLYLGTEAPTEVAKSRDSILKWASVVLRYRFTREMVQDLTDDGVKKEVTQFPIVLEEVNRPTMAVLPIVGKHGLFASAAFLIVAGDAAKLAHYHTGSGAQMGLQQARLFGQYLRSGQTQEDWLTYERARRELVAKNVQAIDEFLLGRQEREYAAMNAGPPKFS